MADRVDQPHIGVRYLRRTLITRARIESFLLDNFAADYETARADLLGWYKHGRLEMREDSLDGVEYLPQTFVRMLKGEHFGKQLVRLLI